MLQIHFQDTDQTIAQQGAQAFATAYFDYSTQRAQDLIDGQAQSIADRISALQGAGNAALRAQLQAQLSQIQSTPIDPGEVLVDAAVPTSPTSPNLLLNIALAAILGAFVGLIAAFIRERMDDRLRGRPDLEETIGAPVMTMIPEIPSWRDRDKAHLVTLEAPRSPAAEAYRTLRTSILVAAADRGYKTLMVVSAIAGEGKTTTAANLAVVLAQADKRVVLISADLRRPRLHEFFGLSASERGLSEVLEGDRKAWEALRSGKVDNLWIMSSGRVSDQPTELLQSEAMRELLADQREVVDFIIIDCPPVLAVADALVVAPMADAILYVANEQTTPRGAVIAARAQLDQVGARLLGARPQRCRGQGDRLRVLRAIHLPTAPAGERDRLRMGSPAQEEPLLVAAPTTPRRRRRRVVLAVLLGLAICVVPPGRVSGWGASRSRNRARRDHGRPPSGLGGRPHRRAGLLLESGGVVPAGRRSSRESDRDACASRPVVGEHRRDGDRDVAGGGVPVRRRLDPDRRARRTAGRDRFPGARRRRPARRSVPRTRRSGGQRAGRGDAGCRRARRGPRKLRPPGGVARVLGRSGTGDDARHRPRRDLAAATRGSAPSPARAPLGDTWWWHRTPPSSAARAVSGAPMRSSPCTRDAQRSPPLDRPRPCVTSRRAACPARVRTTPAPTISSAGRAAGRT